MQAREVSEAPESWQRLLEETLQPEAGLQSPEWALLKAGTGWSARRFMVGEEAQPDLVCQLLGRDLGAGIRMAYAPRGPIWRGRPGRESLAVLMNCFKELQPRPTFIRIDPALEQSEVGEWLTGLGFRRSFEQIQPEISMVVDLHGTEEDLLARMPQKGRYNIRVAQREGVKVRVGDAGRDREAMERLFRETAERDRIGVHPAGYYLKLLELLGGRAELLLAEFEGQALALSIIEYRGRWSTYLHGASGNEGRDHMPNYLLQWEMIRRSKARGCSFYDMRGVGPAGDRKHPYSGLRIFKSKFGGVERRYIGAYDLVLDPARYGLYRVGQAGRKLVLGMRI
jgi:peptidoglycan pentaglycine glycine transferase (the first glycine)